jgi:hypothetical protein
VKPDDIQEWVDRYGCSFIETSALSGSKVEDAFHMLTEQIIEKLEQ